MLRIRPRIGAYAGLAALGVWTSLYVVSAVLHGSYSIVDNYLSDLGHPQAAGNWAFNAACIFGGLLFIPYGLAVGPALGSRLGGAGSALIIAAGFALFLVGVFPEESPNDLHFLVSLAFFILLTLSAAVLAVPLLMTPSFGRLAGYLAGAAVAGSAAFLVSGGSKLLEHVAVYTGLVWALWTAIRLGSAASAPRPISPAPSAAPGHGPPVP